MLELIRRCPYCQRENPVSATSYAGNPYCDACFDERVQAASDAVEAHAGPIIGVVNDGGYLSQVRIKAGGN